MMLSTDDPEPSEPGFSIPHFLKAEWRAASINNYRRVDQVPANDAPGHQVSLSPDGKDPFIHHDSLASYTSQLVSHLKK